MPVRVLLMICFVSALHAMQKAESSSGEVPAPAHQLGLRPTVSVVGDLFGLDQELERFNLEDPKTPGSRSTPLTGEHADAQLHTRGGIVERATDQSQRPPAPVPFAQVSTRTPSMPAAFVRRGSGRRSTVLFKRHVGRTPLVKLLHYLNAAAMAEEGKIIRVHDAAGNFFLINP